MAEAWTGALTNTVLSAVTGLLAFASVVVVVATSGQTEVARARVAAELDAPAFRVTTVASSVPSPIRRDALEMYTTRSDVDAVLALGPAVDHRPTILAGGGDPFPVRRGVVVGASELLARPPDRVGLLVPEAANDRPQFLAFTERGAPPAPVTGTWSVNAQALPRLSDTGLLVVDSDVIETRTLVVVSPTAQDAARHRIDAPSLFLTTDLTVETAAEFGRTAEAVSGEVDRFSRRLLIAVVAVGAALVGLVSTVSALLRARELGRRRALGASQGDVASISVIQIAIPTITGTAIAGGTVGTLASLELIDAPPPGYLAATAWLLIVAAVAAATIPALILARRDPVRILRRP